MEDLQAKADFHSLMVDNQQIEQNKLRFEKLVQEQAINRQRQSRADNCE